MYDVVIVGGGLSGLALAQGLERRTAGERPISYCLIEAADRVGGRILCTAMTNEWTSRHDLGPTWIWPREQKCVADFIQQYGLAVFPQWQTGHAVYLAERGGRAQRFPDPKGYADAQRIVGGAQGMIDALLRQINPANLYTKHKLLSLRDAGEHVELVVDSPQGEMTLHTRRVVLCIPPRLAAHCIVFMPTLDNPLLALMQSTPTWMAGHAKVIVRYNKPFWRNEGLSGNGYAHYAGAMLGEIFDACDVSGQFAALGGFMALPAELRTRYRADLEYLVIAQLVEMFGAEAAQPLAVHIQDWFQDSYLAVETDRNIPEQHPRYGHRWLTLDHWNDKLLFAGTETDDAFGGYLEGALRSARRALLQLS